MRQGNLIEQKKPSKELEKIVEMPANPEPAQIMEEQKEV